MKILMGEFRAKHYKKYNKNEELINYSKAEMSR